MLRDDRPATLGTNEALHSLALDEGDRFRHQLDALQERWENRLTRKDFHALGESYARGRLALVCYLQATPIVVAEEVHATACVNRKAAIPKDVFVLLIEKCNVSQLCDSDGGHDQIVLVDVVGLPDLPQQKVPSTVRLYALEQEHDEAGKCFHYATARWRFLSRFGGHEGLTKRLPRFIGWETYSRRRNASRAHHSSHDVVESGAEIMERVPYRQNQVHRNGRCLDMEVLRAGLRVALFDQFAEIGLDVQAEQSVRLLEVAVGPIDL